MLFSHIIPDCYIYAEVLSQYEYHIGVKLYELRQFGGSLNVENKSKNNKQ